MKPIQVGNQRRVRARGGGRLRSALASLGLAVVVAYGLALPAAAQSGDEPWAADAQVPERTRALLLGLKTAESGIPYKVRTRLLDRFESIDVPGRGAAPDRYSRASVEGFGVLLRSFEGASAKETVYLLQFDADLGDCSELSAWLGPQDRVGRRFCRNGEDGGNARIQPKGATRFGFAAYRLDAQGRPKNVTKQVFPQDPYLRLPENERAGIHDEAGLSAGAWVDRSRLSEVPVLRLYLEYGDGYGLPRSHPRAFSGGYPGETVLKAHLGFLVWNGQRFELRENVPRALWPCTYDETLSARGRSCDPADPDPFIGAGAEAAAPLSPKS
jgi:hypothetical protein